MVSQVSGDEKCNIIYKSERKYISELCRFFQSDISLFINAVLQVESIMQWFDYIIFACDDGGPRMSWGEAK